jgi:molecular chaperone DnaK (HSP70)
MAQVTGQQMRSTVYQAEGREGARHDQPPAIAERSRGPLLPLIHASSPASGAHEFIGVRTAGGLVQKLFEKGTADHAEKSWYMTPLYTDQTTADVSLLVGTGPYIENNKLWQRYVIRDIPPGPNRRILVTVRAGFDPKAELPTAALVTGNSSKKKPLTVKRYRDAETDGVPETPQELRPPKSGRLPATPGASA